MKGETHSVISNESAILQKLGFESQGGNSLTFAKCVNRLRTQSTVLTVLMTLVFYFQAIGMAFLTNFPGMFDQAKYLHIFGQLFQIFLDWGSMAADQDLVNIIVIILIAAAILTWVGTYLGFIVYYNKHKTFSSVVVQFLFYLGYCFARSIAVIEASCIGYCLRPMFFHDENGMSSAISLIAIIAYFISVYIFEFMLKAVHSSPDVNVKDKTCTWPQNIIAGEYHNLMVLTVPLLVNLLKGNKELSAIVPHAIVLVAAIGGYVLNVVGDAFLFPLGRTVITTEYMIMIAGSIVSIIYHLLGGDAVIYILVCIVLVVVNAIVIHIIGKNTTRAHIDILYSEFEDLTDHINTPAQCIGYIKLGLIFNCPCVFNKSLLTWAMSRWPNDQKLILMISYVQYILRAPYRELLDLVSVAIDIHPFHAYDNLLFGQIFCCLPTKEQSLMKRLEGVKRLYDLPQADLKTFWNAILTNQWDEVIMRSNSFRHDIEHISEVFENLMFENPASDAVLQEFVKFCTDVQGNHALGGAAQLELMKRRALEANDEEAPPEEGESFQQMSKLSSVRSSVFLSDASEVAGFTDKSQHNIQMSVLARPIYWPNRFLATIIALSIISLASVIVVFVIVSMRNTVLNEQIALSGKLHQASHIVTQIMCQSLEFSSWNESHTVSGQDFDHGMMMSVLNMMCNELDTLLGDVFTLHKYLPYSDLRAWVDNTIAPMIPSPIETWEANMSLVGVIRLFHTKARTVAFAPVESLGVLADPSAEIMSLPFLYSAVTYSITTMMHVVANTIEIEREPDKVLVLSVSIGCLAFTLVAGTIGCIVVVLGVKREVDLILTVYGSMSPKVLRRILTREIEVKMVVDKDNEKPIERINTGSQQKRSVALKYYHGVGIIFIFILVAMVTVIPVVIIVVIFLNHYTAMQFVENGLELSVSLVENVGHICLYSFRFMCDFPSVYSWEEELVMNVKETEDLLAKYTELYFGGTESFPTGLIHQDMNSGATTCQSVVAGKGINAACMNFHQNVYLMKSMVEKLASFDIKNGAAMGGLASAWWKEFYPAASASLSTGLTDFYNLFVSLSTEEEDSSRLIMIIGLVIGCVLFCGDLLISWRFRTATLKPAMMSLLKPIMLLQPESIINSPFLMRFLQGDFDDASRKTNSEKRSKTNDENNAPLMDFILEGVLVMSPDGVIIASNKKYHDMMANTAEEVLGVNVRTVMPTTLVPLYEALDRIKDGKQQQQNVSMDTILFTEDARELNVRISFVSHINPSDGKATCAFIISDRSDLIKTQSMLRREKQNVEELLDSILPHNIAVSLLNGQTEISFEVEKACILFSDIVSFTPMCSNMTAKQVMNMLNHLFTEFDTELGKFRRVTKLKTIGDAYVCGAGIFEGDGPLEEACTEIVSFGMRMQELIVVVNQQLGTAIHMRIGIHTDGPLICGVLGKEKPLFECIGNVVTLAEDLEALGRPDKIHVAQATVNLIKHLNLKISERGDDVKVHGIEPPTFTIG